MDNQNVEITKDLITALLREQHPDLADLPLSLGALGWDNQLWRLGDDLAVRLPWATEDADELLLKEHRLLPALASRLPLPIPVPKRLGRPGDLFPRSWIVTTWIPVNLRIGCFRPAMSQRRTHLRAFCRPFTSRPHQRRQLDAMNAVDRCRLLLAVLPLSRRGYPTWVNREARQGA